MLVVDDGCWGMRVRRCKGKGRKWGGRTHTEACHEDFDLRFCHGEGERLLVAHDACCMS